MASLEIIEYIRDPIYGLIGIDEIAYSIINTQEFRRLHDIKQLGCLYYVYPGAKHDRFQHCVGVYHLARMMVNSLAERMPKREGGEPELDMCEITTKEKICVAIAGLCHDIGHGAQSHLFERFLDSCKEKHPKHEEMSVRILKRIIEKGRPKEMFDKHGMGEEEIQLICDMILGSDPKHPSDYKWVGAPETKDERKKEFLMRIVSDSEYGMDVDRFDYITRDSYYLGIPCQFQFDRFICNISICFSQEDNQYVIGFNKKLDWDIAEFLICRMSLYRKAYHHKKNMAIEHMLLDSLVYADNAGFTLDGEKKHSLSQCTENLEDYLLSTDCIFEMIRRSSIDKEDMKKAKELLNNLNDMKLYEEVRECKLIIEPNGKSFSEYSGDHKQVMLFARKEVMRILTKGGLCIDDLAVDVITFSLSKESPVPKELAPYYDDNFAEVKRTNKEISEMLCGSCWDVFLRIYSKKDDKDLHKDLHDRLKRLLPDNHRLKVTIGDIETGNKPST